MVNKRRPLTDAEMMEVHHCLSANVDYVWKMCYLQNLSLMASMTDDIEWQFEICAQIDELQYGQIKKSRGANAAPTKNKPDIVYAGEGENFT